jgi:hypothetical protein
MLRKAAVSISVSLKSCKLISQQKKAPSQRLVADPLSLSLSVSPTAHVLLRVPGAVVLLLVRAFCRPSSDQGSTKTSAEDIVRRRRKRTLAAAAGFQGHTRRREGRERQKHRPKLVENAIAIVFFATLQLLFVFFILGSSLPRVTRLIHPS